MTLNVIIQNMVAVDSEVSLQLQRTSDDSDKSELFTRDNYHGVLIGNGNARVLLGMYSFLRNSQENDLDTLMTKFEKYSQDRQDERYTSYLNELERRIKDKYRLISDVARREECISKEFASAVEEIYKQLSQPQGTLYIVAFDKRSGLKKYRIYDAKDQTLTPDHLIHVIVDGSGGDLAGAYLNTNTSGINWDSIRPDYNFYLITLACAAATANAGVGGFMRVAEVGTEKVSYVNPEKVNTAVRVCSKQIAGELSKKDAIQLVKEIYSGTCDYAALAARLDLTKNDFLYAPCRIHQDVSKFNRLLA